MAATVEWDIPFVLSTPVGDLTLNGLDSISEGYFMLNPLACSSGRDMRAPRDDVPQASGDVMHPHYSSGYTMQLAVEMWEKIGDAGEPALRELKVDMWDRLMLYLNSLLGDFPLVAADGRVYWTPRGKTQRMLNSVRLLELPQPQQDADGMVTASFRVLSPFPYVYDAPETNTDITTGATVTNGGSANFFPVLKVHGPTNDFTITNESVLDQNGAPLSLVYDSSLPGAAAIGSGDYVEFVFFRNTAYLNGNEDNMKKGIDVQNSDFWPLAPGENIISVSGYTGIEIEMLWQNAYA